jgi:hypothetical protein
MYLSGETVMLKNMEKLFPTKKSVVDRLQLLSFGILCCLASWIWVLFIFVSFIKRIFTKLKDIAQSKPEKLKEVMYPLYNNKNLTLEKIWAHVVAKLILLGNLSAGEMLTVQLKDLLLEVKQLLHDFDKSEAIAHLSELNVVSKKTLDSLKNSISESC